MPAAPSTQSSIFFWSLQKTEPGINQTQNSIPRASKHIGHEFNSSFARSCNQTQNDGSEKGQRNDEDDTEDHANGKTQDDAQKDGECRAKNCSCYEAIEDAVEKRLDGAHGEGGTSAR